MIQIKREICEQKALLALLSYLHDGISHVDDPRHST